MASYMQCTPVARHHLSSFLSRVAWFFDILFIYFCCSLCEFSVVFCDVCRMDGFCLNENDSQVMFGVK